MEILDAYDLTGSLRDAAELAGCSHHTVKRYVTARDQAGTPPQGPAKRAQVIDAYLDKVEEWVDRSKGKVRADMVHAKLVWLGYTGSERTTRRAVADVKAAYRIGHRRVHRPWITEPGMWLQYDYGDGPLVDGVKTVLFVAWVAWSRFRVVLPLRDKTLPSVFAALDVTFRRIGGVPTYVLTDNEKTVTVEHIAGIPVRNPQLVEWARHYAVTVHTCVPADPASKGGTEASVKLAKADLVPTSVNLRDAYASFADLEAACLAFCDLVNTRPHRITRRPPADMLAEEKLRLHPVAATPFTVAFGTTRQVPVNTPMVAFEAGQYSVPHELMGATVWVRVHGRGADEQVIITHVSDTGPVEVARLGQAVVQVGEQPHQERREELRTVLQVRQLQHRDDALPVGRDAQQVVRVELGLAEERVAALPGQPGQLAQDHPGRRLRQPPDLGEFGLAGVGGEELQQLRQVLQIEQRQPGTQPLLPGKLNAVWFEGGLGKCAGHQESE